MNVARRRPATRVAATKRVLPVALIMMLAAACSEKLPSRPDETKFRAMTEDDKCRATASRAIMCTNEIIVEEARSMAGSDSELLDQLSNDIADTPHPPKEERRRNILVHKTACAGDRKYADAVFSCWTVEDCKKFAACVIAQPANVKPTASEPSDVKPGVDEPSTGSGSAQ
jgi:hypothetical protein